MNVEQSRAGRATSSTPYRIKVKGFVDPRWFENFNGLDVTVQGGVTTVKGPVNDQAALDGLLSQLHDLGLCLLLVQRL